MLIGIRDRLSGWLVASSVAVSCAIHDSVSCVVNQASSANDNSVPRPRAVSGIR